MNPKRIAIIVIVTIFAALTWWGAKVWLAGSSPFSDWGAMLWPAVALMVLGAVTGLAWMLLDTWRDRALVALGAWATFTLFWPFSWYYLSVLPVFVLLWFGALRNIRNDLSDRHTVRISATLAVGMNYILFGVFLMVSLGFYLTPYAQKANETTVSEGIQSSLQAAYENDLVRAQLNQLPPAARAQVQREITLSVDKTIRAWLKPVAPLIPPVLALGLFLVLWSVSFFFRHGAIFLAMGTFAILKQTGFVKIQEKDVKAEAISL